MYVVATYDDFIFVNISIELQDSRHSMKSILNEYKAIVGRGTDPVVIDPHVANIVKGVSGKYIMSRIHIKDDRNLFICKF